MASWVEICDILEKYARRGNEMEYQDSIIDLLFMGKLGWRKEQIRPQLSIPIGSGERAIPDIVVTKDDENRFVVEVKEPSHEKASKDIAQLVSYMKLLETPVGLYIGKDVEVYYKNLGDGSTHQLVMSLQFNPNDENGKAFVSLFSESDFSIGSLNEYIKEREEKIRFESDVKEVVESLLSEDFKDTLKSLIAQHYSERVEAVVEAALEKVRFDIRRVDEKGNLAEPQNFMPIPELPVPATRRRIPRMGCSNNGVAQRYAYNLIKSIIEKNPGLSFRALYHLFGYKNYIENLTKVSSPDRWCMDKEDVITIADGTKVVVSNQWGFNGNCKTKMDRLRELAQRFDIDASLPFD